MSLMSEIAEEKQRWHCLEQTPLNGLNVLNFVIAAYDVMFTLNLFLCKLI